MHLNGRLCQNSPAHAQLNCHWWIYWMAYGNYTGAVRWRSMFIWSGLRMKCFGRCIRFRIQYLNEKYFSIWTKKNYLLKETIDLSIDFSVTFFLLGMHPKWHSFVVNHSTRSREMSLFSHEKKMLIFSIFLLLWVICVLRKRNKFRMPFALITEHIVWWSRVQSIPPR